MLNKIKQTASNTIIYSIGNLSTKIVGLLLLPLYTSRLSLLNYGRFTILEVTMMFLTMVLGLRIVSAMMRWSSETNDEKAQGKIFFNTYWVLILNAVLINILAFPLRSNLSQIFFDTADYSHFFIIIFGIVSLEIINQIPMNILRFNGKAVSYSAIFVSKLTIILFLNIWFLVYAEIGVIGIFYSQLIANLIVLIFTTPFLWKKFTLDFDFNLIKDMLYYSIPLIFSAISVQLLAIADRFIIKQLLDYSQVGIYSLGAKIAGVLNVFVVQAFALSFLPIAYQMLKDPNAKAFYRKIFKYLGMILVFFALGLSLFSREVITIFARKPEFIIGYQVVPLLTVTFVFKGIQYMFMLGFHYVKKTKLIAYIVTFSLAVNIALNYLLIPRLGIWGAALSTLVSSFIISLISYFLSQKYYPVKYEIGKFFTVLMVGLGLYSLSVIIQFETIWIDIIYKLSLCIIFPIILYILRFYEKSELAKMLKVVKKFKK